MALRHSWFPGSIPSTVPRGSDLPQDTYSGYSYPPPHGSSTAQDGSTYAGNIELREFTPTGSQPSRYGRSTTPSNNSGTTRPVPVAQHPYHPPYQHSGHNGEGYGQAAMNKQPSLEQMKMTPQVSDGSPHPAAAEEGGAHQKTPKRKHHGPPGNREKDPATLCINFCVKALDGC